MTHNVMIMLIILGVTGTALAQTNAKFATPDARIAFAKKNIAMGLQSKNSGVVESSLMLVAKMKMQYPGTDIAELVPLIDAVAVGHPSEKLRFKAYIASIICTDPLWFSQEYQLETPEAGEFFIAAARRLQQKMIGMNTVE